MPKGAETFIQKVVKEAGEVVLKRFGKDGVHYSKSAYRSDAVTKADLRAEKLIISRIKERYPGHGIISEESETYLPQAQYMWVTDPIDGTLNFSLGVPMFAVMICLVHRGKVMLSAIYLPVAKELFFAKVDRGAYLNGKKIHCSRGTTLEHSIGVGSTSLRTRLIKFFRNLLDVSERKVGIKLSSFGSTGFNASYVACGRRDWIVSLIGGAHDFGPIALLLKEAGCKISDAKGNPWKFGMLEIVAANPTLHKELLKLTRNV